MAVISNMWGGIYQNTYWGSIGKTAKQLVNDGLLALNTPYDNTIGVAKWSTNIVSRYYNTTNINDFVDIQKITTGYTGYSNYNVTSISYLLNYNGASLNIDDIPAQIPNNISTQWTPNATSLSRYLPNLVHSLYPDRFVLLPRVIISDTVLDNMSLNDASTHISIATLSDLQNMSNYYIIGVYCDLYSNTGSTPGARSHPTTNPIVPFIIGDILCNDTVMTPAPGDMTAFRNYPVFNATSVGSSNTAHFTVLNNSVSSVNRISLSNLSTVIIGTEKIIKTWTPLETSGNPESKYANYWFVYDVNADTIIKQAMSLYNLPIALTTDAARNGTMTDANIALPNRASNGDLKGYTTGVDNANNSYYNNINNPSGLWNNGYPADEKDTNDYVDKIDLNTPGITSIGKFNRSYAITGNDVANFAKYLWNADKNIFDEIIAGLSLIGGNPIDGVIDLRLYPFNILSKTGAGTSTPIVIGRSTTNINGVPISNYNAVLDLGNCNFIKYFNNFLDYEPYTTASLYIPYIGIVPIPTQTFIGKTINVKMIVDITTGACCGVVFAGDIPVIYKNGNIGIDIPMTATNSTQYASRIMSGLTSGVSDITMGAAAQNVGLITSGVGNIVNAAMATGNTIYNTAGSTSPSCGIWTPQRCYFIINRPITIVPDNYGHTVGYACNYQSTISECSGYTQTYNVDVSTINAPESEKNAIAEILNSGFYA